MATFTEKEVVRMAAQIVAGASANPAAAVGITSFDVEAAMASAINGVTQSLQQNGHEVTNDPP